MTTRSMTLAATMTLLLIHQAAGQAPPAPAAVVPVSTDADVYRAARSAIAEARNRAARLDLGARKQATTRNVEAAMRLTAARYGVSRETLDRIVAEGEKADGTAARKAASSAKVAARANVQGQLDKVAAAQVRAMTPPAAPPNLTGLRASDAAMLSHTLSGNPNPVVAPPAAPFRDRLGPYRIDAAGRKVYQAR